MKLINFGTTVIKNSLTITNYVAITCIEDKGDRNGKNVESVLFWIRLKYHKIN